MRAGQRVRPAASNGSAAHPRAGVGTLLRGRAADATRGPAMRIPSRHAQDRQRTRTHTRHPQEQQATAHAPTDAREWCRDITDMARKVNRVVDPPQTRVGSTHARSAGMASSGVRPEPTWADASHAAPTSEPHPCRRPAARQARPIREEEGHAQTSAVSARRPAYGCPPRPFARGSTRNTSRPTNTATSHAHSNIVPLLRERAR